MSGRAASRVIVLGALSAIGEATARLYAADGSRLILAGRNIERLEQVGADLTARGAAEARPWPVDFVACLDPVGELERMAAHLDGSADAILLFFGALGDQALDRLIAHPAPVFKAVRALPDDERRRLSNSLRRLLQQLEGPVEGPFDGL